MKKLLFTNIDFKQTIFKNTFWLAIGEAITRLLKLGLIIYVARILGVHGYGMFTFALSFVGLFVVFSDFGLSPISTREFSSGKEKDFVSVFSLKILLSIIVLIIIFIGSFIITHDVIIRKAIWILAIFILSYSFSEILYALIRARQKMQYEAGIKIVQAVLLTGLGFLVILKYPSVVNLSYAYVGAGIISLIVVLIFFYRCIFPLRLSLTPLIWKKFLFMAWPIGLAGIFHAIEQNFASLALGYLGQLTATGWYNAAWKIAGISLIPSILLSQSFLPSLSRAFKQSKEKFQNVWNFYAQIAIILAIPLAVGGITLAPKIILFIYTPEFMPSILVLQMLLIIVGLLFIGNTFGQALIAAGLQKKLLWVAGIGAGVNVFLNIILIPKYGLYSAPFAFLIAMFVSFILGLQFIRTFTSLKVWNRSLVLTTVGAIISTLIMYAIISQSQIYSLNILLITFIGAAVYFIVLFGYRKVNNIFLDKRSIFRQNYHHDKSTYYRNYGPRRLLLG
ncbi:flippase [Patescibacteria group bacterium AH-259-L07]|nr:flippase [Patescibacteria group bacterium AH-259-L07]